MPPRITGNACSAAGSLGSGPYCAVCTRRLQTFRRKRQCQVCSHDVCHQCIHSQPPHRLWSLLARGMAGRDTLHVCVACARKQIQRLCHGQYEEEKTARLEQLEFKHFGRRSQRHRIVRHRSYGAVHVNNEDGQAYQLPVTTHATQASPLHECGICASTFEAADAIFTTACCHSFHWLCIKNISQTCPVCVAKIDELQAKKQCDHSRVNPGNRFCRDCGQPTTELATIKADRLLQAHGLSFSVWTFTFTVAQRLPSAVTNARDWLQCVVIFPWLHRIEDLALCCVRGLFYGLLYVVYGAFELIETLSHE